MIYLTCLCITVIIVLITDIFQFWNNFSSEIISWITKGKIKKPINIKILQCSVCQNFWIGLLYLLIVGHLSIFNIMYILLLSFSTKIIYNFLLFIEEVVISSINKLNNRITNENK